MSKLQKSSDRNRTMELADPLAVLAKSSSADLMAMEENYNAPCYACIPVVVSRAKGAFLYDPEGRRYFDFLASFGAANQGHCHPAIIEAVRHQLERVTLSSRAFYSDMLSVYTQFVTSFFGYQRVLPMNSGVEAAETAVKLARKWGYVKKGIPDNQANIILAHGNFWGRTIAACSTSDSESCYKNYGPFCPGFQIIDYDNVPAFEEVLKGDPNICAFMVEPIQGEAGVIVPSVGYLKKVKELCEKYNVLLIADEIQSGCCRTGRMLCCDHEGVRPDILVLGKALSGGVVPVSAVFADDDVMLCIKPGTHGSTYGGNPLGCAAAIAALKVLRDEKLDEKAEKLGAIFREAMRELKDELPWICSVRGRGLMNAVEVIRGPVSAWDVCLELAKVGILTKPTHEMSIRFTPPLVITEAELREAIVLIKQVFTAFR